MHKVVVFSDGWGGELFAKYLTEELTVVEVTKVIDWRHRPYGRKGWEELIRLTEAAVRPYVSEADVIVLASYEATVAAIEYLRVNYPEQRFVGFEPRLAEFLPADTALHKMRRLLLAAPEAVRRSINYKVERSRLSLDYEVIEVDTVRWSELVGCDALTAEAVREDLVRQGVTDLGYAVEHKLDAVLVYTTDMADQKELLEEVLGWQVYFICDFERALREVYAALGLKGAVGGNRKWR